MQFNKERMGFTFASGREEFLFCAGLVNGPWLLWVAAEVLHFFFDSK